MQPKWINQSGTSLALTRIKLAQMDSIEIKAIIKQGENSQVEFKECQDRISHSVYETVCSFLNYKGGTLLLGVNDAGEIIGVNKGSAPAMVKNLINTSNNEELFVPYANVMPEMVEIDGMTIIVIQIPEGESVYQYKHRFFDRNGDADVDVTKQPQLLNQLFERKSQNLFESRCVAGLKVDDLDGDTFVQCRKVKTREGGGHPWGLLGDMDLLRSCQLVRSGKDDSFSLTYAALLLFGTEESIVRYMPRYRIECVFRNYTYDDYISGKDYGTRYDDRLTLRCNLQKAYIQIMAFVQRYLPDRFYIGEDGLTRQDLRTLLFREIVANLCVHADYSAGFASYLEIFKDRVVTRNSSRVILSAHNKVISIDQLGNYTKNPLLVRVFRELGWVEDLGSGTRKIRMYAPLYSNDSKIEIKDEAEFVFSITYAKGNDLAEGGSGKPAARRAFPSFMHEAVYVALKHYPEIKVDEILTMINTSRRTLYRILADLRKDGFVENIGNKNHPKWNVYNG